MNYFLMIVPGFLVLFSLTATILIFSSVAMASLASQDKGSELLPASLMSQAEDPVVLLVNKENADARVTGDLAKYPPIAW